MIAGDLGHEGLFMTLTCPSRMHKWRTHKGRRGGGVSGWGDSRGGGPLCGTSEKMATAAASKRPLAAANINVDMIIQNVGRDKGETDVTFTVPAADLLRAQTLLEAHGNWSKPEVWNAIRRAGQVYTYDYYLTALDLELHPEQGIQVREDTQIYLQLYSKTLNMALVITIFCALLGYPLAYYLAGLPENRANLLLVLVLLPFWTSLLVRTTAWIALLQTNGVINSFLLSTGLIGQPFEMLYTSFATIIAMTHILLPFMILPLYSVMRGIDPSYLRAAMSLGAKPIPAFARIYFPMTLPGLSAGALLVFIISVGYYITPALVGGTDGQMISNIIAFHMQRSNNWELAAALGSLLLGLILLLYWLYDRFVGASNIKLG